MVLIMADQAPQHRARIVQEALDGMGDKIEMAFLPPDARI